MSLDEQGTRPAPPAGGASRRRTDQSRRPGHAPKTRPTVMTHPCPACLNGLPKPAGARSRHQAIRARFPYHGAGCES